MTNHKEPKGESLPKLTRGQKNELARKAYQERTDKIKAHGYFIKTEKFAGEYRYYIHKDGVCIHPGGVYEDHYPALVEVERLIEKAKQQSA